MGWQQAIVFVVVAVCAASATWSLMPQAARRVLARGLLRLPLPPSLYSPLRQAAATASGGCHCSGCDHATPKSGAALQAKPMVFQPRKRP